MPFLCCKSWRGSTILQCKVNHRLKLVLHLSQSQVRESVLIISTDPAHNLSDAFGQKITKNPTGINGFDNLFAMEIDPTVDPNELAAQNGGIPGSEEQNSLMADLTSSIPGIDEAMSFAELMKQVQTMEYSVIVFDTAPTGHTLRLIQFPTMLEKGLSRILGTIEALSPFGFSDWNHHRHHIHYIDPTKRTRRGRD